MAKRKPTIPRSIEFDKARRRIRGRPWSRLVLLLLRSQFGDVAAQPVLVVHHLRATVGMHHREIPGRDHLPALRLGRIPVGGDVAFGALEDHQRLAAVGKVPPVRIGAREMAFDDAEASLILEDRRQMAGKQA